VNSFIHLFLPPFPLTAPRKLRQHDIFHTLLRFLCRFLVLRIYLKIYNCLVQLSQVSLLIVVDGVLYLPHNNREMIKTNQMGFTSTGRENYAIPLDDSEIANEKGV
jgi:hypothetical protein